MALAQLVNPGCAGGARQLRLLAVDAVGRADLRHAGAGAGAVRHGRARATARRAVPLRRRACAPRRSRTRRPPTSPPTPCFPTCLAGVNFVLHTAGWLEGGLAMGYEKFVMDADQAGMMHTLLAGVDLSENGQALDAIREVGPGKHFLGLRAHAGQLRDRLLSLAARRQQQRRAVGGGGRQGHDRSAPTRCGRSSSPSTRRRRSIRRSMRRCSTTSTRRKASFPDSNV